MSRTIFRPGFADQLIFFCDQLFPSANVRILFPLIHGLHRQQANETAAEEKQANRRGIETAKRTGNADHQIIAAW